MAKDKLTFEMKLNYMRIACGIAGFGLEEKHFDMLVSMYDLVLAKEGNAKLDDMVRVKLAVDAREEKRKEEEAHKEVVRKRQAYLDTVSTKVDVTSKADMKDEKSL